MFASAREDDLNDTEQQCSLAVVTVHAAERSNAMETATIIVTALLPWPRAK